MQLFVAKKWLQFPSTPTVKCMTPPSHKQDDECYGCRLILHVPELLYPETKVGNILVLPPSHYTF